jgi:two-component system, LuxR family, response regulator FixJ
MLDNESLVYIVDDDIDVRDALSLLMKSVGLEVQSYSSGKDFLTHYRPHDRCCLILDIRMPKMSGVDLQNELKKRRINLPIIFLTGHGDVPIAVRAMKAGAVDFIQKPLEEHRLIVAVLSALKHQSQHAKMLPDHGTNADAAKRLALLSSREKEVLRLMIDGMTNRNIADALHISIKTVEFHRANIREKIGVNTNVALFRLMLENPNRDQ